MTSREADLLIIILNDGQCEDVPCPDCPFEVDAMGNKCIGLKDDKRKMAAIDLYVKEYGEAKLMEVLL